MSQPTPRATRRAVIAAALVVTGWLGAIASSPPASAAAPPADSFAGVPSPATVSTKYVGLVNAVPLGINLGANGGAIAY